ncbi:MAG: amidohydrolase family protein [Chloroflexota bacterium]
MYRNQVIDPHHHLWDVERYPYPGLSDPNTRILRRYGLEDFLADAANRSLTKSVHLQGEVHRNHSLDETAWLQSIADQHGFPHGIVAYAPLQDPGIDALLAAHAQYPNLRGIRQILNPDQCERDDYLRDPSWQAGYARLAQHGLLFDLQALPSQFADAARVARAYPNIPMVINHTGMPRDQTAEGTERWRAAMRLMAEQPNVSVKMSGFGMFDPAWTADSIRPLVLGTIELFGVERCMFASNFPVDKVFRAYDALYDAFETLTSDLTAEHRHQLFHANAERTYRL